jgi:hypothetical protein
LTCAYLWLILGMLFRLPGLLAEQQARRDEEILLAQQHQAEEEESLELQGAPLSHADAGP